MTPEAKELLEAMARGAQDGRWPGSWEESVPEYKENMRRLIQAALRVFVEWWQLTELGTEDPDNPHLLTLGTDEDGAFLYAQDWFYSDEFVGKALLQLLELTEPTP